MNLLFLIIILILIETQKGFADPNITIVDFVATQLQNSKKIATIFFKSNIGANQVWFNFYLVNVLIFFVLIS